MTKIFIDIIYRLLNRGPSWARDDTRAIMGLGMMSGLIWKRARYKLFIAYLRSDERIK